ncbi:MAG: phosphotransferase enzyme family protein [Mycobacterium leprae]
MKWTSREHFRRCARLILGYHKRGVVDLIHAIKQRYKESVLQEAAARYGVTADGVKAVGGWESFVYQYNRDGRDYILKITHTIRRSESYLMGELEWLNFLADGGIAVSRAVPSVGGHLVERIADGAEHAWLAMAYEKAPGHRVTAEDWNEALFVDWGRLVGRIHRLTQSYRLSNPAYKRQEWYEEEQLNARKYLPPHEAAVIARADQLMAQLAQLPTPPDAYGLLHTDLHHGNFFVDQGRITAFDFDDCGYNWFANDIGVLLICALDYPPRKAEEPAAFATLFLKHFLRGYDQENRLDPYWLEQIRNFMLLRDLLWFISLYQAGEAADERSRLAERRQRILEGRLAVEPDWGQFVHGTGGTK